MFEYLNDDNYSDDIYEESFNDMDLTMYEFNAYVQEGVGTKILIGVGIAAVLGALIAVIIKMVSSSSGSSAKSSIDKAEKAVKDAIDAGIKEVTCKMFQGDYKNTLSAMEKYLSELYNELITYKDIISYQAETNNKHYKAQDAYRSSNTIQNKANKYPEFKIESNEVTADPRKILEDIWSVKKTIAGIQGSLQKIINIHKSIQNIEKSNTKIFTTKNNGSIITRVSNSITHITNAFTNLNATIITTMNDTERKCYAAIHGGNNTKT